MRPRRGFTMVEMMVVVTIVAILSLLAVVTYDAPSNKAAETGTRSELTSVAGAELAAYERQGAFVDASQLPGWESAYSYTAGAASGSSVSVAGGTDAQGDPAVGLAAVATDGVCLQMLVVAPGSSGSGLTGTLPAGTSCTGQAALAPSGPPW